MSVNNQLGRRSTRCLGLGAQATVAPWQIQEGERVKDAAICKCNYLISTVSSSNSSLNFAHMNANDVDTLNLMYKINIQDKIMCKGFAGLGQAFVVF